MQWLRVACDVFADERDKSDVGVVVVVLDRFERSDRGDINADLFVQFADNRLGG